MIKILKKLFQNGLQNQNLPYINYEKQIHHKKINLGGIKLWLLQNKSKHHLQSLKFKMEWIRQVIQPTAKKLFLLQKLMQILRMFTLWLMLLRLFYLLILDLICQMTLQLLFKNKTLSKIKFQEVLIMDYILLMTFVTEGGSKSNLSINGVKPDTTSAQVNSLMDTILAKNIFYTHSGSYVQKAGASLTQKSVTKFDMIQDTIKQNWLLVQLYTQIIQNNIYRRQ
eukprot:TRINITY_DN3704_c0_g1_i1.p1 TRINITY_DN3704_c0_g1~~TRINITY_DN3704_c0_g1_i1.p1  ORF type:complete len:225 (-),score=-4.49 TRINITY_DN3704_c0_g1_i1:221-895(-)